MASSDILTECARVVYEGEKDVSFSPDSTYIVWYSPQSIGEEMGLQPLTLARPDKEDFKVIRAHLFVGWDVAETGALSQGSSDRRYAEHFAERFMLAYEAHPHDICLAAAEKLRTIRQMTLVTLRKPISGIIDVY